MTSPAAAQPPRRRGLPWLVGGAVLALHAALAATVPQPVHFDKYPEAARLFLAGEMPAERALDFSPLYLGLVELWARLGWAARPGLVVLQIGLVALVAALLTADLEARVGRAWALAAAAIFALDHQLLAYERTLEPEIVQLACVVAALVLLRSPRRWAPLAAGAAAAASLATRSTLLPLLLAAPLLLRLAARRGGAPPVGVEAGVAPLAWRRRLALYFVPVAVALLLLAGRGRLTVGDFLAPSMNPGTVFFEGNQPLSQGTSAVYPPLVSALQIETTTIPDAAHVLYREVARAESGPLDVAAVNRTWARRAFAFLRDEPGAALRRLAQKARWAGHRFAPHDILGTAAYAASLPLPELPWGVLFAVAVVGMLVAARRPERDPLDFGLFANQLAVMLVFYVSSRQRLLLLPALLLFAGRAVAALAAGGRRAWGLGALAVVLALPLVVLDAAQADARHQDAGAFANAQRFSALAAEPGLPPAERTRRVVSALAAAPWFLDTTRPAYLPLAEPALLAALVAEIAPRVPGSPSATFDLAVLELRRRDLDAAERLFTGLAAGGARFDRQAVESSSPTLFLARIAALRGDRAAADRWLAAAAAGSPGDPFVLAERAALADDAAARARLERYLGRLDARWLEGRALLELGAPERAASCLREVAVALPGFRGARLALAAALGDAGQIEEGARVYLSAFRQATQPLGRERSIVPLFRRWSTAHPGEPWPQLLAAQVLFQYGHLDEAWALLAAHPETASLGSPHEQVRAELARARAAAASPSLPREGAAP